MKVKRENEIIKKKRAKELQRKIWSRGDLYKKTRTSKTNSRQNLQCIQDLATEKDMESFLTNRGN